MGAILGRIRDAVLFWAGLALVAVLIAKAGSGRRAEERPPAGRCAQPGCQIYYHSPEAWARSEALGRTLAGLEAGEASPEPIGEGPRMGLEHPWSRCRPALADR